MEVHTKGNKLVIITEPKFIYFDLHKDVWKTFLAEHTIKNEISQLLVKCKHGKSNLEHER